MAHSKKKLTYTRTVGKRTIEQYNLFGEIDTIVVRQTEQFDKELEKATPKEIFINGLIDVLGMKKAFSNGEPILDQDDRPIMLVDGRSKELRGKYRAGDLDPLLKQCLPVKCVNYAFQRIVGLFEAHENESLVVAGMHLLTLRLRLMRDGECPLAIRDVFVNYYVQEHFAANERSGETERNIKRREAAEKRRREKGMIPRNFRANRTVDGLKAETPNQNVELFDESGSATAESEAPKRARLPTNIVLSVCTNSQDWSEDAPASDDTVGWRPKKDSSFIVEYD